ncbi:hypothetical protein FNF28_00864 [Cafeteria roenbergensis]|uniref:2-(3-amino-3-carboxypropyl)histidine synthase subunit 1 n=1 Tax=Cafeteria roenbergensis TaxID=33653 RepID=A0A5A8E0P6_CAFRO|nr:hypothetical protein FNF28_00864 [Cafeteria roenbergensis]
MASASPAEPAAFKGRHEGALVKVVDRSGAGAGGPGADKAVAAKADWEVVADDPALQAALKALPSNYEFEVPKIVARCRKSSARVVALQFPEGLLAYSLVIADILERFTSAEVTVLADVVYGACCVDDLSAEALGADLLVHFGHSCLVPVSATRVPCMYVFVEITFDPSHLVRTVRGNLDPSERVAILGTIQFAPAVAAAREALQGHFAHVWVPQQMPLSPGEVLGCTSPRLPDDVTVLVFVADGRFHLESAMIQNPSLRALRYDPYGKVLTEEGYDTAAMTAARKRAIDRAKHARRWGVVVGTLGRQGNPRVVDRLRAALAAKGLPVTVVLLSEVFPAKLALMRDVEAWVQVCCPRLSVDWGAAFDGEDYFPDPAEAGAAAAAGSSAGSAAPAAKRPPAPLLSPYEAFVALGEAEWLPGGTYPMDFYSSSGGKWTNYYQTEEEAAAQRAAREAARAARKARLAQARAARAARAAEQAAAAGAAKPDAEAGSGCGCGSACAAQE